MRDFTAEMFGMTTLNKPASWNASHWLRGSPCLPEPHGWQGRLRRLTCEQQHQEEGKEVRILGQHVLQVQSCVIPEESGDVAPNDVVKGGAPGPSHTCCP